MPPSYVFGILSVLGSQSNCGIGERSFGEGGRPVEDLSQKLWFELQSG